MNYYIFLLFFTADVAKCRCRLSVIFCDASLRHLMCPYLASIWFFGNEMQHANELWEWRLRVVNIYASYFTRGSLIFSNTLFSLKSYIKHVVYINITNASKSYSRFYNLKLTTTSFKNIVWSQQFSQFCKTGRYSLL